MAKKKEEEERLESLKRLKAGLQDEDEEEEDEDEEEEEIKPVELPSNSWDIYNVEQLKLYFKGRD